MRSILIVTIFAVGLASAADGDFEEVRELSLGSRGIDALSVDNGSGSIDIVGVSGSTEILVSATLVVPARNDDKARERIRDDLKLTLDKASGTAVLIAHFEQGSWFNFGDSPSVNLEIRMPQDMHLMVDDGSGSIEVQGVHGDIALDDGSGSITLADVGGQVEIDDGSGSITAHDVGGDISINDGSGGITIRGVSGSVTVDDGSGGIDVQDVEKDLIIVDDGSGGLDFANISGRVQTES